jgi:hypothetical protein
MEVSALKKVVSLDLARAPDVSGVVRKDCGGGLERVKGIEPSS